MFTEKILKPKKKAKSKNFKNKKIIIFIKKVL